MSSPSPKNRKEVLSDAFENDTPVMQQSAEMNLDAIAKRPPQISAIELARLLAKKADDLRRVPQPEDAANTMRLEVAQEAIMKRLALAREIVPTLVA